MYANTPVCEIGLFHNNRMFIKRDDLIPFSFGGNKARKAEYFFQEIDTGNFDCVVTYGSSSSNHCRVVTNMAAARGIPCYIISPREASKPTYNSQMIDLLCAERKIVSVEQVHATIESKLDDLRQKGKKPYFIQGGGHGNLGTQAYVDCYNEIWNYEQETGICFDYIFLASGTGTTQAGLICGELIHQDNCRIIGISIARKKPYGRDVVLKSIWDYVKEKKWAFSKEKVESATEFLDTYVGDGYGMADDGVRCTIQQWLKEYGIPLDVTYTGKAAFGMQKYIEMQNITDRNILFIHTGGTPLFFDYLKDRKEV